MGFDETGGFILFLFILSLLSLSLFTPPFRTHANAPLTQRVAVAARSVLGTTLDITHEALLTSVDLLDLAPVPGLAIAARTLLNVWDCLQKVDVRSFFKFYFGVPPQPSAALRFFFLSLRDGAVCGL